MEPIGLAICVLGFAVIATLLLGGKLRFRHGKTELDATAPSEPGTAKIVANRIGGNASAATTGGDAEISNNTIAGDADASVFSPKV